MDWYDFLTPEQAEDAELIEYLERIANAEGYVPSADPIERQLDEYQDEIIAHIKAYGRTYVLGEDAMCIEDDELLSGIYREYNMQEFNWLRQHGLGATGFSMVMFIRAGMPKLFELFLEDMSNE